MKEFYRCFHFALLAPFLSTAAFSQTDTAVQGELNTSSEGEPTLVSNQAPTTIKFGMEYGNPIPPALALQIFSNTTLHQLTASTAADWANSNGFSADELSKLKTLLTNFQTSFEALEAERLKASCSAYDEAKVASVSGRTIEMLDYAYTNLEALPAGAFSLYESAMANIGNNFSQGIEHYVTVNIENIIETGTASAFDYRRTNAAFGITDEMFFADLCN